MSENFLSAKFITLEANQKVATTANLSPNSSKLYFLYFQLYVLMENLTDLNVDNFLFSLKLIFFYKILF